MHTAYNTITTDNPHEIYPRTTFDVPEGDRLGFAILVNGGAEVMLQTWSSAEKDAPGLLPKERAIATLFVEVDDFQDYIQDLKTFFVIVRTENPQDKIFLIGHSMGSAISLAYTVEYQQELAGLITSGGGLTAPGTPPLPQRKPGAPLSTDMLSRDPEVIRAYVNDPLVYRGPAGKLSIRFK